METEIVTRERPALPESQNGNGHGAVSILEVIERASLNPAVDVDKMRALLEMHEHVLDRNAEAAFNAAMTKAQTEMPVVVSDKINLHTKSKYPSLEAVQRAIKDIYMKHGFTCTFAEDGAPVEGVIHVVGTVRHVDGHSETFHRYAPADTKGPGGTSNKTELQGAQSTVSFLQRKLLCAIWGVTVADEDKDGNKPKDAISKQQLADLKKLAGEVKKKGETAADVIKAYCTYMKIDAIENLPASLYESAVTAFKKRGAAEKSETVKTERSQLTPAPTGQAIDKPTIKVITSKMELAALSVGDFKKRFGLDGIEQINCKDITVVLGWIIDPQNA